MLKNYLYSLLLQFFKIAAPILVIPFVYRQISPYEMGQVNLVITIMTYFYITGDLGTYIYGFREISLLKDDPLKINRLVTELFIFRAVFNTIIIIAYLIFFIKIYKNDVPKELFWIAGVQLLATFFSVEWIYEGFEKFKFVSLKTIIVRSVFLLLTVLTVKGENAPFNYLFTITGFLLLNNLVSFVTVLKLVKFDFTELNPFRHFKKMVVLFIMTNWSLLYFQTDKLLLGFWNNLEGVSFYTLCERVVLISSSIVFSLVMVATPKLGNHLNSGIDLFKVELSKFYNVFFAITIFISSSVLICSTEIIMILGGIEYKEASSSLKLFSLMIIFYLFLEQIKTNVMLLLKKENIFFISVVLIGVISVAVKYLQEIKEINQIILGTVITTFIVVFVLIFYLKMRKLDILNIQHFVLLFVSLVPAYYFSSFIISTYIVSILIKSVLFAIMYFLVLYLIKNPLIFYLRKKLSL